MCIVGMRDAHGAESVLNRCGPAGRGGWEVGGAGVQGVNGNGGLARSASRNPMVSSVAPIRAAHHRSGTERRGLRSCNALGPRRRQPFHQPATVSWGRRRRRRGSGGQPTAATAQGGRRRPARGGGGGGGGSGQPEGDGQTAAAVVSASRRRLAGGGGGSGMGAAIHRRRRQQ